MITDRQVSVSVTGTYPVAYDLGDYLEAIGRGGTWQGYVKFKPFKSKWFKVGHEKEIPEWDSVYVNMHPMKAMPVNGDRTKEEDIAAVGLVYGDADMSKGWTQERIDALPLRPSLVLSSGGGWYPIWLFKKPVAIESVSTLRRMKVLQEAVVTKFGFDNGAKDLARVLRVPYSWNNKYGEPRLVVIQDWDKALFYGVDELERYFIGDKLSEPPASTISQRQGFAIPTKIHEGESIGGYSGRDDFLFKYGCHLLGIGKSIEFMKQTVRDYNAKNCIPSLDDETVEQKIAQALKYHDKDTPKKVDTASMSIDELDADETYYKIHRGGEVFEPLPPIEYIVDGLFEKNTLTVISGKPGSMKTSLLLHIQACVSTGEPFLNRKTKKCNTLYLNCEMGDVMFRSRTQQVFRGLDKASTPDGFMWLTEIGTINLWNNDKHVKKLKHDIEFLGVEFLVVDALSSIMLGGKENDSDCMAIVMSNLRWLCEQTGCTIVVIHHMRKDGESYRGSTEILAKPDNLINVKVNEDEMLLQSDKMRNAPELKMRAKTYFKGDAFHVEEPERHGLSIGLSENQDEVQALFFKHGQLTIEQVQGYVQGQAPSTAKKSVYELVRLDILKRVDSGTVGKKATYDFAEPERRTPKKINKNSVEDTEL